MCVVCIVYERRDETYGDGVAASGLGKKPGFVEPAPALCFVD